MPEKKYAPAKIVGKNGITVIELYMNGSYYGEYPINEQFNYIQQIKDAINDAKDYGYDGICLE